MRFIPKDYQKYCIERAVTDPTLGLWIKPGLGKTVISLMAVKELKYARFSVSKALVIAPKKVAEATWSSEAAKWDETKDLDLSLVLGTARQREAALKRDADIYVINRENVPWLVDYYKNDWPFDMVIIDESSSFKNPRAKRVKALATVRPHIKRIIELTGTPRSRSLLDVWAQVYLLDGGKRLGNRYAGFRDRYFNPGFAYNGIVYNYTPKEGSEAKITSLLSDICITLSDKDYLSLPDLIERDVPVKLSPAAEKKYKDLERNMVLEIDEDDIAVTSAAALSNKLLQLANGAVYDEDRNVHHVHDDKIDRLLELMEEIEGENALIFYNFVHDKDRIMKALEKAKITARTLDSNKEIEQWNKGQINALVAHPASSAYGLNIQEGGHHIIWFGLTWNFEHYYQAIKRLHRQGQKMPVIVHRLITMGTRDEDVIKAQQKKEESQEAMMESLKAHIKRVKNGQ